MVYELINRIYTPFDEIPLSKAFLLETSLQLVFCPLNLLHFERVIIAIITASASVVATISL